MLFYKGHGTENDFIILDDPTGQINLTPELIRALCDRRAGLGADGVLRVLNADTASTLGYHPTAGECEWFMDYRNADGTTAEMCGNGVRVFAHFVARTYGLKDEANCSGTVVVGTRAGLRPVVVHSYDDFAADVEVDMGVPEVLGVSTADIGGQRYAGLGVSMGNPHLACVVPGLTKESLADIPVEQPIGFDTEFFPAGVNTEILTPLSEGKVYMRVHERGAGETRSCGTGTVASAVAALADAGQGTGEVDVHVPGGVVHVSITEEGSSLRGPSAIVAKGEYFSN
ncbi:MAG: diaminopimelate epimerase [Corynebacterium sp.]|nr:diaminopimelate epimerase [Corynebacterium sp.]